MNFKKFTSAVTAVLCCAGMMTVFPEVTRTTTKAMAVDNDFEVTYEGWYSNGETSEITAVDNIGFGGSRGMTVTGRTVASDGAASSKGFYLWGGVKYDYSVQVYSETDETFHISLLCKDRDTEEETIVQLAEQTVKGGEWTEISATYKAPENSYEYLITITTDSTNDFVFDDFKVSTKETKSVLEAEAAGEGLKDAFAGYGFRIGNILNGQTVKNDAILANYLKDFNAIECENETKPDATLDQSRSSGNNIGVRSNSFAAIADFCVKNNLGFRGHVLVWHSQTPQWFFKDNLQNSGNWVSSSTMDARLESYIKNMFNMYKTEYPTLNLYAYDVVNEATSDDSNRTANYGGAREPGYGDGKSPWVQVYGSNAFIEKAFTYARQYAPSTCQLYYNDYNEYWDHKRDSIIKNILTPLASKGLLDGMGMQSHIDAGYSTFSGTVSYLDAMDKYLALGIDVQITEIDVSLDNGQSLTDQANKYKAILQHVMDVNTSGKYQGKVNLVQFWGPNDANTWINGDKSPLLYDKNNQPKSAYTTLMQLGDGNGPLGDNYSTPAAEPEPNEYGWWYQCDFEDGDDNWTDRGGNKVAVSTDEHYTEWGSHSLYVSGRTSAWMGAALSLSSRIFKAGESYSFSAHVKQNSGEAVKFMMKIEYTDGSGETAYDEVANVTAPSDTWAQLANTSYTIPSDASNIKIYVETEESLTDFYLDEAIGAQDGIGIQGEGQPATPADPSKAILGDINYDGVINALDVAYGRSLIISNTTDAAEKKAADVDRSGKYEINDLVLIQEYVLNKINEFPRTTVSVDTSAFETLFKTVSLKSSYKKDGENNPIYTQRFGADPGWLVYDGRLYVYTTADAFEYSNGQLKENSYASGAINVLSTADLVNWTDHGQIPVAKTNVSNPITSWANNAWAPDAAWKTINGKDKFFLYFANNGSGIGVITGDDPTFSNARDPLGKELISRSTPNSNVTWLFDPGVYYDKDTDTGIIAYGGGVPEGQAALTKQGRIVKLGDDMISIVGTPIDPGTPYLFEDSSMIKIGEQWIYSFCHNWSVPGGASVNGKSFSSADIGYMTSTNPLDGYTYQGVVFKNTGTQKLDNGGNNHHSIIEFKGGYYVLYHSRQLEMRMGVNGGKGLNYRSPCIDKATVNGTSISCQGSQKGVSQIEDLNPYETVRAATMSNQSTDITVNGLGNTTVTGKKGSWIRVSGANFKNGASTFTANGKSGTIKVCAGGADGEVLAYAELNGSEVTVPVLTDISGKTDITIVFGSDNASLTSWSFS